MNAYTSPERACGYWRGAIRAVLVSCLTFASVGCSQRYKPGNKAPEVGMAPSSLSPVQDAIVKFKEADPRLAEYFSDAFAYAIFPVVGKGAFVVGGAQGKGRVFEQGRLIGNATVTQVSVGFQWGGQAYSQVIFFRDKAALDRFKAGRSEFSARASAVVADAGVSADSAWSGGVAVFTRAKGGLMAEAAIGGQTFKYLPLQG